MVRRVGNSSCSTRTTSSYVFFPSVPITKFIILHFFPPGKALKKKKAKLSPILQFTQIRQLKSIIQLNFQRE